MQGCELDSASGVEFERPWVLGSWGHWDQLGTISVFRERQVVHGACSFFLVL